MVSGSLLKPLLPPRAKTGRPRVDDRIVLNGLIYVLLTGCRWMDVPIRYGHYLTAFRRLKRWQREGVWSRILEALASRGYFMGRLSLDRFQWIVRLLRLRRRSLVDYNGCRHRKGSKVTWP